MPRDGQGKGQAPCTGCLPLACPAGGVCARWCCTWTLGPLSCSWKPGSVGLLGQPVWTLLAHSDAGLASRDTGLTKLPWTRQGRP
jgi:hypothetical protein